MSRCAEMVGSFRADEPAPHRTPSLASVRLPQGRAQGQRGEAPHSLRTAWSPHSSGASVFVGADVPMSGLRAQD